MTTEDWKGDAREYLNKAVQSQEKGWPDRATAHAAIAIGAALMALEARLARMDHACSRWLCRNCGPGVAADEDGCCAMCGADAEPAE